jgi:hypothetical protein
MVEFVAQQRAPAPSVLRIEQEGARGAECESQEQGRHTVFLLCITGSKECARGTVPRTIFAPIRSE